MGPWAVQELQVKLPQFGDFYFFALKTLIFEAQYLNENKR